MQRINVYIDFLFLTLSLRKVSTGNCETLLEISFTEKNNNKTASWFLKIELSTELRMSYKINIYRSECKSSG